MREMLSLIILVLMMLALCFARFASPAAVIALAVGAGVVSLISIGTLVRIARKTHWQTFARMQNGSLEKSEMRRIGIAGATLIIGILVIIVVALFNVHVGYLGKMDNPPKFVF